MNRIYITLNIIVECFKRLKKQLFLILKTLKKKKIATTIFNFKNTKKKITSYNYF
jgi:hypothetical protein